MSAEAIAWALRELGPGARVVARRRGEEADLWHVRGSTREAWLKRHRHAAKAARERATLQWLGPHLRDEIPAVLGAREPDALLISACPGEPARLDALDSSARDDVLAQAGAFLRRLTDVPLPDAQEDSLALQDAYARRIRGWLARAAPTSPAARLDALRRGLDPAVFAGVPRTLCHRDFQPGNWLIGDGPGLGVIDFGQARPDDWLVDLAKLDPVDVDAVLAGFGRPLDGAETARLEILRHLHELATLSWAHLRGRT